MLHRQKIKYIYDTAECGIKYDYDLINKEFIKMLRVCKAPKGLYMPTTAQIGKYKWNVFLSERSSSKTTQWLLYGMVMNALYGTVIQYVRKTKDQITKVFNEDLFKVILMSEYNYIGYLSNGKYNSIHVDRQSKDTYYCKRDDSGAIEDIDTEPFITLLSVDQMERYCSGYNAPTGDLIIFDEFSRGTYKNDEWIAFNNILATIRREKESTRIVMLSNTVSIYNQYLQELGISKDLKNMKKGTKRVVTAVLGAKVWVEWLDVKMHKTERFKRAALEYYGFENPKLKSIYGGEWEYKNFPRLPKGHNNTVVNRNIYLECMGSLMVVEVMAGDIPCINIRPYLRQEPLDDAIVLTDSEERCNKPNYYKANRVNFKNILYLYQSGKVFFGNNECGIMFENIIKNLQYI